MFLAGPCEEENEDQECETILDELENIDDELDEAGIIFVTTEDTSLAKKHGVKKYPSLVFFRNKMPLIYEGTYGTFKNDRTELSFSHSHNLYLPSL